MKGLLTVAALLIAALLTGTAHAQYGYSSGYSNGGCSTYCPPTHSSYATSYTYSGWTWACWPKNHAYYYKTRYAYDSYGNRTLQHDGWLYTRAWHNGAHCYYQHCKIPVEQVAQSFPVEKVIVREVPILVAPVQVGTTAYGGIPVAVQDTAYSHHFPVKVNAFGRLEQVPVTSLAELASLKVPDDGQAVATSLALTAKYMAEASGKVAADAQQTIREKNAALAANQKILIQGAVAENAIVKALQSVSALGTENVIGDDGALNQNGADALSLVISANCLACHGGEKTEAGLDFRKFDEFDRKTKVKCLTKVATGQMPPASSGKKELNDQQVKLFEAWVMNGD